MAATLASLAADTADVFLAPFVAISTMSASLAGALGLKTRIRAEHRKWPREVREARVAAEVNEGIVLGVFLGFWPAVIYLVAALPGV